MSIFGNIMNKIFHHGQAKAAAPGQANTAAPTAAPQQQAGTATATAPAPAQTQQVDVGSVLSEMASMKGGGGNISRRSSTCSSCSTSTPAFLPARSSRTSSTFTSAPMEARKKT